MTTLYLDRRDLSISLEGQALVIHAGGTREGTVPLHLLERVVMRASVSLQSGVLARLADQGIGVVAFGGRNGSKVASIQGSGHNDAARRIGQYQRYGDPAWREAWARRLVLAKVQGQSRLLARALRERPDLRRPLTEVARRLDSARTRLRAPGPLGIASVRGIEGAAGAAYFPGLVALMPESLGFSGRNRRPPRDPVNAALSLGYTLLHYEAVRACHGAGLDPLIGYYHDLAFGRESLACDLIEPLRPRLDGWVWEQFRTRNLTADHFTQEAGACLLGKSGREHYFRAYETFARPLRRFLRRLTGRVAAQIAAGAGTGHLPAWDEPF